MALDDIDAAISDYEPTDTEGDVQDENVQMQNAPDEAPGSTGEGAAPVSNGELDRISGTAPATPTMPASQLGNPNPMQAANSALAAGNATADAERAHTGAIGEHEQFLAQEAQDREVQSRLDEQERKDQAEAQQAALEKTHQETEAATKKFDEFKFHDHWKEAPVGHKVLAMLFSGIGGAAAARTGGPNEALRAMDDISQREYNKDVQGLNKAETFMKWKKEGETDLRSRFEKEKTGLQMQQAARLKSMADSAESHYMRTHPGATVDEAKNNVIVQGLTQKAAETYSGAVQNIYKIEAAKQAALLKAKKGAGGGGVTGQQLSALSQYAKEHPGDDPGLYKLAGDLKVSPKHMIAAVTAARAPEEKRVGNEEKADVAKDARTVTLGGKEYLAPSARNVTKVQERATNYDDAERSLEELLDYHKSDPIKAKLAKFTDEDRYHRAVLAVAAVTTANASDKTTAHEAGTINRFGLGDKDAIQRTLDHIKERKKAFIDNLRPRDDVASAAKPEPVKPVKSSIPPDVIERAKARAMAGDKKAIGWLAGHGIK